MFEINSIIISFFRITLLVSVVYYCHLKLTKQNENPVTFLQFVIKEWFKYGSITLLLIFIFIQLGIYSLFNLIVAIILVIFFDSLKLKNIIRPVKTIKKEINDWFFCKIKEIEAKATLRDFFIFKTSKKNVKELRFIFILSIILIVLAFIGRYYFFVYDTYLMSDLWLSNLKRVIDFDKQIWFNNEVAVNGELAFINFYSKITDVSPEVALQSAAIFENVLLSLVLFWALRKITTSEIIAPLISFFVFVFLYTLSPVEINYLLQNDTTYLALTFAIPAMIYALKPEITHYTKINYFISFILVFIAIGLVDLFTLIILLPPFFVVTLLFINESNKKFIHLALLGYVFGCLIILGIYYFYCWYIDNDFTIFFQSSIVSVTSFTYMPYLAFPLNDLMLYHQYISIFGIVILPILIWFKKENWRPSLVFLLYFNLLVVIYFLNLRWIDQDALIQSITVFIPVVLGIIAAIFVRLFQFIPFKISITKQLIFTTFFSLIALGVELYLQKNILTQIKPTDKTPRKVLQVYDKITHSFFPYSYAVVNDVTTQIISEDQHFFINYEDFLYQYAKSDSVYHKHKKDKKYFIKNPEAALPKSVLLFVYPEKNKETNNIFSEQKSLTPLLLDEIKKLKKRGREVNVFFEDNYVKVFEIVNEPHSSKINDLIY